MSKIGVGLSTEKDPVQAAREAVVQAKLSLQKEKINLAIAFSTVELPCAALLKTIGSLLGPIPVIGCSSAAVISNYGINQHGLVIMLLSFPEGIYCNTASVTGVKAKTASGAGAELGEKLLKDFPVSRRDLSILFSDCLSLDSSHIIEGMQSRLGKSFPLAGACASDNLRFLKTCVYHNQEALSDACAAMLWGGKLNFGLGIKHGWKPLGKPRKVTLCEENIVHEIDNTPAANVYKEYLSCDLAELRKQLKHISVFYPVGIQLPGEDEYLIRSILAIKDNGSLVFQGNVPQGSIIRLMIGTQESCLNATRQAIEEVKGGLFRQTIAVKKYEQINFLLVFDSISRAMLLGRKAHKELDLIKEAFGADTPIIGLYSHGEEAPLSSIDYFGRTYFHNHTITIIGIGM